MVKCSKCGIENKETSEFCHNCGNKLTESLDVKDTIRCSGCGAELNANATFCPKCGKKVENASVCKSCGAEIPDGVAFCPNCGTKVESNQKNQNACTNCGAPLEEESIFCPECGCNVQTGIKNPNPAPVNPQINQSFLDRLDFNILLKPTIFAVIFALILASIGVIIGLSWLSFIIAIIISTVFFAGLIKDDANAIVMGLFTGLILGLLENPIIQFWWGIYAAAAYEWLFGGQILLLIILGIVFAFIGNMYFKQNIQEFSQKHLKWLLNLLN